MFERTNRTFICSVVFLDIVEYSKKPVGEQIGLKERFTALLSAGLQDIAVNDRIILDTGDGAAISFLGDPEDPLFVAMSLRDTIAAQAPEETPQLEVRLGINLGPVRLVKDINGQPNIIGDGINVAQRIMSFAKPGQVLVSRSYYEVVSRLSQEYTQLFRYEGSHTDKHVREHEVYAVGYAGRDLRETTSDSSKQRAKAAVNKLGSSFSDALGAATASLGGKWLNKKVLVAAPLAVAAILATGLVVRGVKHMSDAATETPTAVTAVEGPRAIPEGNNALVGLAIAPWGEVYVDGKKRGVSPPLMVIQVSPGRHTIEIRNSTFPSYTETIEVKPRERVKIKHRFR